MEPELVRDMGVRSFKDMKDLLAEVDFNGKDVYVIPYWRKRAPADKGSLRAYLPRSRGKMEARSNEYSSANSYFICASAVLHQHLCVLQPEKGFRELPLYKGKNNAFVVAASIAGPRSVVLRRSVSRRTRLPWGCRQAGMIQHGRSARLFLLCWQSVTCVEASTRPSAVL